MPFDLQSIQWMPFDVLGHGCKLRFLIIFDYGTVVVEVHGVGFKDLTVSEPIAALVRIFEAVGGDVAAVGRRFKTVFNDRLAKPDFGWVSCRSAVSQRSNSSRSGFAADGCEGEY